MNPKMCGKCKELRPRENFTAARNRKDGLYPFCKDCDRPIRRAYYEKHRAKIQERSRVYGRRPEVRARDHERAKREYWENRDHHLAHAKQWRRDNLERRRAYVRQWNEKNRELVRQYQKAYKARKRGATESTLTIAAWRLIKATFRGKCVYCGVVVGKLEQEHVQPLLRGGAHAIGNVVPACRHCNATKHFNPAPPFWWVR